MRSSSSSLHIICSPLLSLPFLPPLLPWWYIQQCWVNFCWVITQFMSSQWLMKRFTRWSLLPPTNVHCNISPSCDRMFLRFKNFRILIFNFTKGTNDDTKNAIFAKIYIWKMSQISSNWILTVSEQRRYLKFRSRVWRRYFHVISFVKMTRGII